METSWTLLDTHRRWCERGLERVLWFVRGSILPDGGFAYLDRSRRPLAGHGPQLFLTARMVHTASIGYGRGIPGAGALLDHGMQSLLGPFADTRHGGWFSRIDDPEGRKSAYDHVQVALAAAGAKAVGHPAADRLLADAIGVIDEHLWNDDQGGLYESFDAAWKEPEAYRGANANMHGMETFLALRDATGDPRWIDRSRRVAERIIDRHARAHGWLIPEHYDRSWSPLPDYNADRVQDPFRPYGATLGHSLEWARLLVELHEHGAQGSWLLEAADGLARRALDDAWGLDGRPGLVYTVDWDGKPVATIRLHWPVCEGIQAAAALHRVTGDFHWEQWYRTLWDHAATYFIDDDGAWIGELDGSMREGGTVWPGRPDVYHCAGALTAAFSGPSHAG